MIDTSEPASAAGVRATGWSLVLNRDPAPEARRAALGELCRRYWYPVYAYLRQCGHDPDTAQEIASTFFGELTRHDAAMTARVSNQCFRDFLLQRLQTFLGADWRELPMADAADLAPPPAELEHRNGQDNPPGTTADDAFQRGFAAEVIARALQRLHAEAAGEGHLEMYAALVPYLAREPSTDEYAAIGADLAQRPLALIVALKRLRQRFRHLVGHELADTVGTDADLREEQKALHGFLSRNRDG